MNTLTVIFTALMLLASVTANLMVLGERAEAIGRPAVSSGDDARESPRPRPANNGGG
jgi:hypothetical protein